MPSKDVLEKLSVSTLCPTTQVLIIMLLFQKVKVYPSHFLTICINASRTISAMLARITLILISCYRSFFSPLLHTLMGAGSGCKFSTNCSQYFQEKLRSHSYFQAVFLFLSRLSKCHPFSIDDSDKDIRSE